MGWLDMIFGKRDKPSEEEERIATRIVINHQYGCEHGRFRMNDWLMEQLDMVMTHQRAVETMERFCKLRAHGVSEAERLLMVDIGIAMRLSRNERQRSIRRRSSALSDGCGRD